MADSTIEAVSEHVPIMANLSRSGDINNIAKKASSPLGFIRQDVSTASKSTKCAPLSSVHTHKMLPCTPTEKGSWIKQRKFKTGLAASSRKTTGMNPVPLP